MLTCFVQRTLWLAGSRAALVYGLIASSSEQAALAAPAATPSNVVSVCSGVRLPNSVVTNIVQPLTTAVGALETTTNTILGNVLGLTGIPPVSTNIAGLMSTASTGYTTVQAVSQNGTLIGPATSCYSSADGITLSTPSGVSIGGNTISGLGDSGQNNAMAVELSAIAFGNNAATAAGATDAIAMGSGTRVTASGVRGLALGAGATVNVAESVALGAGSVAARGAQGSYNAPGLGAGQVSAGEISVGTAVARRQITNVAPGSADNDAVNVAQLTSVSIGLTALGNLAVQYNSGSHGTITLAGGAPGTVIANLAPGTVAAGSSEAVNGAQLFATNTNVGTVSGRVDAFGTRLDSDEAITAGINTRVTQNGADIVTVSSSLTRLANGGAAAIRYADRLTPTVPNTGTPSQDVTLVGAAAGTVGLHNISAGVVSAGSTDAINGDQFFALGQNVNGLSTAVGLAVSYDDTTRARVTLRGTGTAPVALGNIAAGTLAAGSTEAVNGAQLLATNTDLGTVSGRVDALGTRLGGDETTIANIDTRVIQNSTSLATLNTSIGSINAGLTLLNNGGGGPVRYANRLTPTSPNGGVSTQDLTLVGAAAGPVGLHNLAPGSVASGSSDAVTGDQLYALGQNVAGLSTSAGLAVSYDDALHARVTLQGAGGAPVVVANVAAGTVAAGSSDAVNGAQLFATNANVTAASNRIDGLGTRLDDTDAFAAALDTRVTQNTAGITLLTGGLSTVNTRVDLLDNGGAGPVRYSSAADPTTPNGGVPSQHVTLVGAGLGTVALHNVASASISGSSTDAVNGSQLQVLGQALASTFGGFTYNGAGNSFAGGFQYGGNTYSNIQSVLGVIASTMNSGPPTSGKYFHANSTLSDSAAAGDDSTAIGPSSTSVGAGSVAMGRSATAMTDSAVAIGDNAMAMNGKAVSIGMSNIASGDGAVSIGDPNVATGDGAVALGKDNSATGLGAIALGNNNNSSGQGAAAIGNINVANGVGAAAIGSTNSASGEGSIAIGLANNVQGDDSIAIGSNTSATASGSLAIGQTVIVTGDDSVALGNQSTASGSESAAVGNGSLASGTLSAALGRSAIASSQYALALGPVSQATAFASTALGTGAISSGFASSSLGTGSIADQEGSVALGSASQTVRGPVASYTAFGLSAAQSSAGEIAISRNIQYTSGLTGLPTLVGDRQITGVAAGSADSDAVNIAQLRGVSARLGNSLVTSLGGGASYNGATGSVTAPTYTVNGVSYTGVGDALTALLTISGTGSGTAGGTPTTAAANAVTYTDASHTDVTLAPSNTGVHNVAGGVVAAGSTDAVNGGQLASTEAKVATLAGQVNNGQVGVVRYTSTANPTTPSGQPSNDAALVGSNATAPITLHNVAAGQATAGSTDAVNGGQLAATNQRVASVETTATSAMTMAQGSVQYADSGHTTVTLGDGSTPVTVHNVADGTSARDAVNVSQLATATNAALVEAKTYTDTRVAQVAFDLGKLRKDANAGTAGAFAIAAMPQPYEAGRGMLSMGAGTFQGQSAIALGIAKALSDEHTVVKVGATYNSRGQLGANAGVGYQF